jgi:hypothetical protein
MGPSGRKQRIDLAGVLAAQDRLAGELHARHITDTDSGHGINVEQPQLLSNSIREVVDQTRR